MFSKSTFYTCSFEILDFFRLNGYKDGTEMKVKSYESGKITEILKIIRNCFPRFEPSQIILIW